MQSGIAADTLLFASYHRAKWSGAPVLVDVASAAGGLVDPKIDETFDDSEKFSIGVGRKFSERLSGSLSYSKEEGIGADAESLFTFSNGTETISAGLRYTIDNMNISVGVSRSTLGDIIVDGGLPNGDIAYRRHRIQRKLCHRDGRKNRICILICPTDQKFQRPTVWRAFLFVVEPV